MTCAPRPNGDMDAYVRSSGAAWSSAARRHFRRDEATLPSRGAFRYRGTQVVTGAEARKLKLEKIEGFEAVTGQGVKGRIGARAVLLGNQRLMEEAKIDPSPPLAASAEARRKEGETVMFLGLDGTLAGLVAVADPIKSSAAEAIASRPALPEALSTAPLKMVSAPSLPSPCLPRWSQCAL